MYPYCFSSLLWVRHSQGGPRFSLERNLQSLPRN